MEIITKIKAYWEGSTYTVVTLEETDTTSNNPIEIKVTHKNDDPLRNQYVLGKRYKVTIDETA